VIRRRLFNFTAAVSLLLWIAVTAFRALLPISGFVMVRYGSNNARLLRAGGPGYADVLQYQSLRDPTGRVIPLLAGPARTTPLTFLQENHVGGGQVFLGMGFWVWRGHYNRPTGPCDYLLLSVDHSFVQLLASLLPILWLGVWIVQRHLSQNRIAAGLCRRCSYSLTGNTSGVCPECGTPVAKAPAEKGPRTA
jgi:hypothetical protein